MQVGVEVRRRALHDGDGAALGALTSARTQAPPIPAEHRVGEDAGDDAEELAVEAEAAGPLLHVCHVAVLAVLAFLAARSLSASRVSDGQDRQAILDTPERG